MSSTSARAEALTSEQTATMPWVSGPGPSRWLLGIGAVALILMALSVAWWAMRERDVMCLFAGASTIEVVARVGLIAWLVVSACLLAAPAVWPHGTRLHRARMGFWTIGVVPVSGLLLVAGLVISDVDIVGIAGPVVAVTAPFAAAAIAVALVQKPRRRLLRAAEVLLAVLAVVATVLTSLLALALLFIRAVHMPISSTFEDGRDTLVEEWVGHAPGLVDESRWFRDGDVYRRGTFTPAGTD